MTQNVPILLVLSKRSGLALVGASSPVILFGIYYGLLTALPIGPSHLLCLQALVLGSDSTGARSPSNMFRNKRLLAAVSGMAIPQLAVFASVYSRPLYRLCSRPQLLTVLTVLFTYRWWGRMLVSDFAVSLRPAASTQRSKRSTYQYGASNSEVIDTFLDSLFFQALNPILFPSPALTRLMGVFLFRYSESPFFLVGGLVGWLCGQTTLLLLGWFLLIRLLEHEHGGTARRLSIRVPFGSVLLQAVGLICWLYLGKPLLRVKVQTERSATLQLVPPKPWPNWIIDPEKRPRPFALPSKAGKLWLSRHKEAQYAENHTDYKLAIGNRAEEQVDDEFYERNWLVVDPEESRIDYSKRERFSQYLFEACVSDGKRRLSYTHPQGLIVYQRALRACLGEASHSHDADQGVHEAWVADRRDRLKLLYAAIRAKMGASAASARDCSESESRIRAPLSRPSGAVSIYLDPCLGASKIAGERLHRQIDPSALAGPFGIRNSEIEMLKRRQRVPENLSLTPEQEEQEEQERVLQQQDQKEEENSGEREKGGGLPSYDHPQRKLETVQLQVREHNGLLDWLSSTHWLPSVINWRMVLAKPPRSDEPMSSVFGSQNTEPPSAERTDSPQTVGQQIARAVFGWPDRPEPLDPKYEPGLSTDPIAKQKILEHDDAEDEFEEEMRARARIARGLIRVSEQASAGIRGIRRWVLRQAVSDQERWLSIAKPMPAWTVTTWNIDERAGVYAGHERQGLLEQFRRTGAHSARQRNTGPLSLVWQPRTGSQFRSRLAPPHSTGVERLKGFFPPSLEFVETDSLSDSLDESTAIFQPEGIERMGLIHGVLGSVFHEWRGNVLLLHPHFRKHVKFPVLITLTNVVRFLLGQRPESREDFAALEKEVYQYCDYFGLDCADEKPERWSSEGLQIKVINPFCFQLQHPRALSTSDESYEVESNRAFEAGRRHVGTDLNKAKEDAVELAFQGIQQEAPDPSFLTIMDRETYAPFGPTKGKTARFVQLVSRFLFTKYVQRPFLKTLRITGVEGVIRVIRSFLRPPARDKHERFIRHQTGVPPRAPVEEHAPVPLAAPLEHTPSKEGTDRAPYAQGARTALPPRSQSAALRTRMRHNPSPDLRRGAEANSLLRQPLLGRPSVRGAPSKGPSGGLKIRWVSSDSRRAILYKRVQAKSKLIVANSLWVRWKIHLRRSISRVLRRIKKQPIQMMRGLLRSVQRLGRVTIQRALSPIRMGKAFCERLYDHCQLSVNHTVVALFRAPSSTSLANRALSRADLTQKRDPVVLSQAYLLHKIWEARSTTTVNLTSLMGLWFKGESLQAHVQAALVQQGILGSEQGQALRSEHWSEWLKDFRRYTPSLDVWADVSPERWRLRTAQYWKDWKSPSDLEQAHRSMQQPSPHDTRGELGPPRVLVEKAQKLAKRWRFHLLSRSYTASLQSAGMQGARAWKRQGSPSDAIDVGTCVEMRGAYVGLFKGSASEETEWGLARARSGRLAPYVPRIYHGELDEWHDQWIVQTDQQWHNETLPSLRLWSMGSMLTDLGTWIRKRDLGTPRSHVGLLMFPPKGWAASVVHVEDDVLQILIRRYDQFCDWLSLQKITRDPGDDKVIVEDVERGVRLAAGLGFDTTQLVRIMSLGERPFSRLRLLNQQMLLRTLVPPFVMPTHTGPFAPQTSWLRESSLLPNSSRELRALECLALSAGLRDAQSQGMQEPSPSKGHVALTSGALFGDTDELEAGYNTIKRFLWPMYRLEDLACMNRFWFGAGSEGRLGALRMKMYPSW